jgi:transposase
MAIGRREKHRRQEELWSAQAELRQTAGHPFYEQLNRLLEARGFDEWVEQQCQRFYAETMGRPSLLPGWYFRLLLIGYFEGLDSERGIAWRATISRTQKLIDVETHQALFRWILESLAEDCCEGGPSGRCDNAGGERRVVAFDCSSS